MGILLMGGVEERCGSLTDLLLNNSITFDIYAFAHVRL